AGAILDWSDRGIPVRVETVSGARLTGRSAAVGRDAIAIGPTLIPLHAIAAVWCQDRRDVTGRRTAAGRPSFAAIAGTLAASLATVAVGWSHGRAPIVGQV